MKTTTQQVTDLDSGTRAAIQSLQDQIDELSDTIQALQVTVESLTAFTQPRS